MTELMTTEEMRAVLAEEEQRKRQECAAEVQKVLGKYGYVLVGLPKIVDGRIITEINLLPAEEQR